MDNDNDDGFPLQMLHTVVNLGQITNRFPGLKADVLCSYFSLIFNYY